MSSINNEKLLKSSQLRCGMLVVLVIALVGFLVGCSDEAMQPDWESSNSEVEADDVFSADKALNTKIFCQGQMCFKPGDAYIAGYPRRDYSYIVNAGVNGVSRVEFGVHKEFAYLYNMIMPAGWTWSIINLDEDKTHAYTSPHNSYSYAIGSCSLVLRFEGPIQNSRFQLAYNKNILPHLVEWETSDGSVANWVKPVGMSLGPVHAPYYLKPVGGTYHGPGDIVPKPGH